MSDRRLTLAEMARRRRTSTKTFLKYVRELGIPHFKQGRVRTFDPAVVESYFMTTEQIEKSNVVAFPLPKKKRGRVTSPKFAEAR